MGFFSFELSFSPLCLNQLNDTSLISKDFNVLDKTCNYLMISKEFNFADKTVSWQHVDPDIRPALPEARFDHRRDTDRHLPHADAPA